MANHCACAGGAHPLRRIVVTGGPGGGKTALLETARRHFCKHVVVLPEAASMLFTGGFPRRTTDHARRAAQRAIYHVQRELETLAEEDPSAIVLCDRGTLDGLAYWPDGPDDFFATLRTSFAAEMSRYELVVHMRTPTLANGYDHANPVRTESAREAAAIDARILEVWSDHPRRHVIESSQAFVDKVEEALAVLAREVPSCCRLGKVRDSLVARALRPGAGTRENAT